jgi:hypothetical protein
MNEFSKLKEPFKTSLPDDDPRAYLMRRRASMATQLIRPGGPLKLMRSKSMRLPMERIPRGGEVYQLIKALPTDISCLRRQTATVLRDDIYVSRGRMVAGLAISPEDTAAVIQRLQDAIKAWVGSGEGMGYEIEFTFGNLSNARSLSRT